MARVIRQGKPKEERCKCACGAEVGYMKKDIKERHGTDYGGGPDGEKWVVCPACGEKIVLEVW